MSGYGYEPPDLQDKYSRYVSYLQKKYRLQASWQEADKAAQEMGRVVGPPEGPSPWVGPQPPVSTPIPMGRPTDLTYEELLPAEDVEDINAPGMRERANLAIFGNEEQKAIMAETEAKFSQFNQYLTKKHAVERSKEHKEPLEYATAIEQGAILPEFKTRTEADQLAERTKALELRAMTPEQYEEKYPLKPSQQVETKYSHLLKDPTFRQNLEASNLEAAAWYESQTEDSLIQQAAAKIDRGEKLDAMEYSVLRLAIPAIREFANAKTAYIFDPFFKQVIPNVDPATNPNLYTQIAESVGGVVGFIRGIAPKLAAATFRGAGITDFATRVALAMGQKGKLAGIVGKIASRVIMAPELGLAGSIQSAYPTLTNPATTEVEKLAEMGQTSLDYTKMGLVFGLASHMDSAAHPLLASIARFASYHAVNAGLVAIDPAMDMMGGFTNPDLPLPMQIKDELLMGFFAKAGVKNPRGMLLREHLGAKKFVNDYYQAAFGRDITAKEIVARGGIWNTYKEVVRAMQHAIEVYEPWTSTSHVIGAEGQFIPQQGAEFPVQPDPVEQAKLVAKDPQQWSENKESAARRMELRAKIDAGKARSEDVSMYERELYTDPVSGARTKAYVVDKPDTMRSKFFGVIDIVDPQGITDHFLKDYGPTALGLKLAADGLGRENSARLNESRTELTIWGDSKEALSERLDEVRSQLMSQGYSLAKGMGGSVVEAKERMETNREALLLAKQTSDMDIVKSMYDLWNQDQYGRSDPNVASTPAQVFSFSHPHQLMPRATQLALASLSGRLRDKESALRVAPEVKRLAFSYADSASHFSHPDFDYSDANVSRNMDHLLKPTPRERLLSIVDDGGTVFQKLLAKFMVNNPQFHADIHASFNPQIDYYLTKGKASFAYYTSAPDVIQLSPALSRQEMIHSALHEAGHSLTLNKWDWLEANQRLEIEKLYDEAKAQWLSDNPRDRQRPYWMTNAREMMAEFWESKSLQETLRKTKVTPNWAQKPVSAFKAVTRLLYDFIMAPRTIFGEPRGKLMEAFEKIVEITEAEVDYNVNPLTITHHPTNPSLWQVAFPDQYMARLPKLPGETIPEATKRAFDVMVRRPRITGASISGDEQIRIDRDYEQWIADGGVSPYWGVDLTNTSTADMPLLLSGAFGTSVPAPYKAMLSGLQSFAKTPDAMEEKLRWEPNQKQDDRYVVGISEFLAKDLKGLKEGEVRVIPMGIHIGSKSPLGRAGVSTFKHMVTMTKAGLRSSIFPGKYGGEIGRMTPETVTEINTLGGIPIKVEGDVTPPDLEVLKAVVGDARTVGAQLRVETRSMDAIKMMGGETGVGFNVVTDSWPDYLQEMVKVGEAEMRRSRRYHEALVGKPDIPMINIGQGLREMKEEYGVAVDKPMEFKAGWSLPEPDAKGASEPAGELVLEKGKQGEDIVYTVSRSGQRLGTLTRGWLRTGGSGWVFYSPGMATRGPYKNIEEAKRDINFTYESKAESEPLAASYAKEVMKRMPPETQKALREKRRMKLVNLLTRQAKAFLAGAPKEDTPTQRYERLMIMLPHMKPFTNSLGYVQVFAPDHPFAHADGYVPMARMVYEQFNDTLLAPWQVVHHLNRVTNDNRPGNLKVFNSQEEHIDFHNNRWDPTGQKYGPPMFEMEVEPKEGWTQEQLEQKRAEYREMMDLAGLGGWLGKPVSKTKGLDKYVNDAKVAFARVAKDTQKAPLFDLAQIEEWKQRNPGVRVSYVATSPHEFLRALLDPRVDEVNLQAGIGTLRDLTSFLEHNHEGYRNDALAKFAGIFDTFKAEQKFEALDREEVSALFADIGFPAAKMSFTEMRHALQQALYKKTHTAQSLEDYLKTERNNAAKLANLIGIKTDELDDAFRPTGNKVSVATKGLKIAKLIADKHVANGGVTYNLTKGDMGGTDNYAVGIFKDREVQIKGRPVTPADYYDFISRNLDIYKRNPEMNVGGWDDKSTGINYLDVSMSVPDQATAVKLGTMQEQKAVSHLTDFADTNCPPPKTYHLIRLSKNDHGQTFVVDPKHMGEGASAEETRTQFDRQGRLKPGYLKKSSWYSTHSTLIESHRFVGSYAYAVDVPRDRLLVVKRGSPIPSNIDILAKKAGKLGWYDENKGQARLIEKIPAKFEGRPQLRPGDRMTGFEMWMDMQRQQGGPVSSSVPRLPEEKTPRQRLEDFKRFVAQKQGKPYEPEQMVTGRPMTEAEYTVSEIDRLAANNPPDAKIDLTTIMPSRAEEMMVDPKQATPAASAGLPPGVPAPPASSKKQMLFSINLERIGSEDPSVDPVRDYLVRNMLENEELFTKIKGKPQKDSTVEELAKAHGALVPLEYLIRDNVNKMKDLNIALYDMRNRFHDVQAEIGLAEAELEKDPSNPALQTKVGYLKNLGLMAIMAGNLSAQSAGRALRQFGLLGKAQGFLRTGQHEKAMRILKQFDKYNEKNIKALLAVDPYNPAAIIAFLQSIIKPSPTKQLYELWINMLLSSPVTHTTNAISNAFNVAMMPIETVFAAGYSKLGGVGYKSWRDAVMFGEAPSEVVGLFAGIPNAMRVFIKNIKHEFTPSMLSGATELTKLEMERLPAISGTKGQAARLPGRFLKASDEMFKALVYNMDLHAQAYNQAVKEKKAGNVTDVLARAKGLVEEGLNPPPMDPTSGTVTAGQRLAQHARDAALYRTFNNQLEGAFRTVANLRNQYPALGVIFPFVRTPVNIVKYALQRTPFAFAVPAIRMARGLGGIPINKIFGTNIQGWDSVEPAEGANILGRATIGSLIALSVAEMVANGAITGSIPYDPEERAAFYREGKQPRSIRIGNKWYSYGRLQPVGIMMGIIADAVTFIRDGRVPDEDISKVVSKIALMIGQNIVDNTFLRGAHDVFAAAIDPEQYGENLLFQLAGSLVPTGLAEVSREVDPIVREINNVFDMWRSRIPTMSKGMPPRVSESGRLIERPKPLFGLSMISPIKVSERTADPVEAELRRLGVFPGKISEKVGKVRIPGAEYSRLAQRVGTATWAKMRDVTRAPSWKRMTDESKRKMLLNIIRTTRMTGRAPMKEKYGGTD